MFAGTLYNPGPSGGPGTSSVNTVAKMGLWPMPSTGADMGSEGVSEDITFEYGGADVVASPQSHRVYEMSWGTREATGASGLDVIKRYSQGAFGRGLIYFADPFNYTTNLLPPAWAEPALIGRGWKNIYDTEPVLNNTLNSAYNQPIQSATWNITSATNATPTDKRGFCVIPIHPDYYLNVGFTGSATGTGVVRVRPINLDGSYAATTDLTLISSSSSARFNNTTFSGSTYKAVEIYFTRTSSATSSVTVLSAMAQLWRSGYTGHSDPVNFHPGQGNTGCRFLSTAIPEDYIVSDGISRRHLKGLAATLVEVGTSRKYATSGG